jgi:hypothetical protein
MGEFDILERVNRNTILTVRTCSAKAGKIGKYPLRGGVQIQNLLTGLEERQLLWLCHVQ